MVTHSFFILCVDTPLLTVAVLLEELKEATDWRLLGAYLNVPKHVLDKINTEQSSVEYRKMEMLQYWLNNTTTASWSDVPRALEQISMSALAERLKLKYLKTSPTTTTTDGMYVFVYVCVCVCVCVFAYAYAHFMCVHVFVDNRHACISIVISRTIACKVSILLVTYRYKSC